MKEVKITLFFLMVFALNSLVYSQFEARLLKNINRSESVNGAPLPPTALGDKVIFSVNTKDFGYEPWVSDGTESGTFMLKDINAGTSSSIDSDYGLTNSVQVDSILFFLVYENYSTRLWRTNGTSSGTYRVTNLMCRSYSDLSMNIGFFKGFIYIAAIKPSVNYLQDNLYKINPLTLEVTLVKELSESSEIGGLTVFDNEFYFSAKLNSTGWELWRSNGTTDSTYMVKDIAPGVASSSEIIYSDKGKCKNKVFFSVIDTVINFFGNPSPGPPSLWKTDGTPQGTVKVMRRLNNRLYAYPTPSNFITINDKMYFTALNSSGYNHLWCYVSDRDTVLSISSVSTCRAAVRVGDKIQFYTSNGIFEVNPISNSVRTIDANITISSPDRCNKSHRIKKQVLGTSFYFSATRTPYSDYELWVSNSTGINRVFNISKGKPGKDLRSSLPYGIVTTNNKVFFYANDGIHGRELWVSDGAVNGETKLTKNTEITPESGSAPDQFLVSEKNLYFRASSTSPVSNDPDYKDIYRYNIDSDSLNILFESDSQTGDLTPITTFKNRLIFSTNSSKSYYENASTGGSQQLATYFNKNDIFPIHAQCNGELIIAGTNTSNWSEYLYKFDTTGTLKLITDKATSISSMIEMNGIVYFKARHRYSPDLGIELWRTDGTSSGTFMVKDILPGYDSGLRLNTFFRAGNYIYFVGVNQYNQSELWRSDGTGQGTVMIAYLSGNSSTTVFFLAHLGNKIYYKIDNVNSPNYEMALWYFDTLNMTNVFVSNLANVSSSSYESRNSRGYVSNGNLYFETYSDRVRSRIWRLNPQNNIVNPVLAPSGRPVEGIISYSNDEFILFNGEIIDPTTMNYISGVGYIDGDDQNTQIIRKNFSTSSISTIRDVGYFSGAVISNTTPAESELWMFKICPSNLNLSSQIGTIDKPSVISASNTITISNRTLNASHVTISAGKSINLLPGFYSTGNTFNASLTGCR
jgi:ELWxxDGT repeat protein